MSSIHRQAVAAVAILSCLAAAPAAAEKIANKVAVFTGLDKITGRIITFDVYIDETVQFGTLRVTPKVCYSRPETEAAATDAFVQVDEITLDDKLKRIFDGWMFASSPGLNAVEHPVYDVWLKSCRMESDIPPPDQRNASSGNAPRVAQPNSDSAAGGDLGEGGGATLINGIPIPPVKPPVVDLPDTTDPNAPTEENGDKGEILD